MASVYTTRNGLQPASNNVDNPQTGGGAGPWNIYYKVYTSVTGVQDWIYAPDGGTFGVNLVNTSAGTAHIDYTLAPPSAIEGGSPGHFSNTDVTASTYYAPVGVTAIRVNITSGNWKLQVRC